MSSIFLHPSDDYKLAGWIKKKYLYLAEHIDI